MFSTLLFVSLVLTGIEYSFSHYNNGRRNNHVSILNSEMPNTKNATKVVHNVMRNPKFNPGGNAAEKVKIAAEIKKRLEEKLGTGGVGTISVVIGRHFAFEAATDPHSSILLNVNFPGSNMDDVTVAIWQKGGRKAHPDPYGPYIPNDRDPYQ